MLKNHFFFVFLAVFVTFLAGQTVQAGVGPSALGGCSELGFSTESGFITYGPEPPDGNPVISDGDLLGRTSTGHCSVCARNDDLLEVFDVSDDIGLDAADVINVSSYIVAFSTELDSPNVGQFGAGDLLITNGAIIPNETLVYQFEVLADYGLDAIHFVGPENSLMAFVSELSQYPADFWLMNPGQLSVMLGQYDVDIWFSTEERAPGIFSDGDLLSARYGKVIPVSAITVDYGLDAATGQRDGEMVFFSTEVSWMGENPFGAGDILKPVADVMMTDEYLLGCFEPSEEFVGLDALSIRLVCADPPSMDFTGDCRVGLEDFAMFASEWLLCGWSFPELCW